MYRKKLDSESQSALYRRIVEAKLLIDRHPEAPLDLDKDSRRREFLTLSFSSAVQKNVQQNSAPISYGTAY